MVARTARARISTDKAELKALGMAKNFIEAELDNKAALKEAQETLDNKVFAHYASLSISEIKTLVVEDKWLASLQAAIIAEIERITQQLAKRVQTLEERYAEPLPAIVDEVAELSKKVAAHLQQMGLAW